MALVDLLTAVITAALDQLKSQAELRDERNLLANIFEQIPVHLFVKDTEARHLRVSTHLFENADIDTDALNVEDFSPSTVTGKTDVELYGDTEQYRQSVEDDLRVIETGEPLLEVERYDSLIDEWFLTSKVPWYDAEGTCKGIMGVATEITTQKEYERALERQNDRLDSFASMVSHDLRNPLGVVQGRIGLALETDDITHLEPAQRAATRMGELIDDMLWLAKEGHDLGAVEAVDIATVARESWSVVGTADARLSVETDTTVQADRSRLAQVFENLFSNAIEHAGSEVTVRVGATQTGIYVSDNGPGIPATERANATEIGVSGRPDGTGLGLAIVREIATAHGWDVTLRESESGGLCVELEGVTFTETSASESQTSGQ
jgi:signal transduction histidine kinase